VRGNVQDGISGFKRAPTPGSALGQEVDAQLVAGSNLNGQTQGLATVAGITTVTWTDASPTAAEFVSKVWQGYREISEAGGGPAEPGPDNYLVVVHPRRLGFLAAAAGNTAGLAGLPPLPGRVVPSTGVRTGLGASTSEDEAYVIARDEVFVSGDGPSFHVHESVGSNTLTVRIQATQYVAAMFSRRPKAIARITGTGMVAPTL